MAYRRLKIAAILPLLWFSGCCWNVEVSIPERQSYRSHLMGRTRSDAISFLEKQQFDSIAYTGAHVLEARKYTGFCYWTISRYFYWVQLVFSAEDERVDQMSDGYGSLGP